MRVPSAGARTDTVALYVAPIYRMGPDHDDGKSLEHVDVMLDDVRPPVPQDLADGRDSVLAYAVETLGVKISPEDAGKAFPYEWPPDN